MIATCLAFAFLVFSVAIIYISSSRFHFLNESARFGSRIFILSGGRKCPLSAIVTVRVRLVSRRKQNHIPQTLLQKQITHGSPLSHFHQMVRLITLATMLKTSVFVTHLKFVTDKHRVSIKRVLHAQISEGERERVQESIIASRLLITAGGYRITLGVY